MNDFFIYILRQKIDFILEHSDSNELIINKCERVFDVKKCLYVSLSDAVNYRFDKESWIYRASINRIMNIYKKIMSGENIIKNEMEESEINKSFFEALRLLKDLADLQNEPPIEQHRKEWEETMEEVYEFLNKYI